VYIPGHFAEHDRTALFDFMRHNSFGLLVSQVAGEPFATHLPFLVDQREDGADDYLMGHVARANPQWKELAGQRALVVFSGPHAYVSPRWYEADKVVPTWNYVAVHVYGQCEIVDDGAALAEILMNTVATNESRLPAPWSIDPASEFFQRVARGVVGFRLKIAEIQGKWKLGQNQPAELRERVAAQLAVGRDESARAIAELMAATRRTAPTGS
jgi:transcriptional regulator